MYSLAYHVREEATAYRLRSHNSEEHIVFLMFKNQTHRPKFGVSTKSQLRVKGAGGLNSVKHQEGEKASKNQKTAYVRGILIYGLVPKGGLKSSFPFPAFT